MELLDLFKKGLKNHASDAAVVFYDLNEENKIISEHLSYPDLDEQSEYISNLLISANEKQTCVVNKQQNLTVGLYLHASHQYVVYILGILKCGWVFAPFDPGTLISLNSSFIKTSMLDYMIVPSKHLKSFFELKSKLENSSILCEEVQIENNLFNAFQISLWKFKNKITDFKSTSQVTNSEKFVYMLHTSGTTGQPKVVLVPSSCIVPNIIHLSDIFSINNQDKIAMVAPPTFDPSIVEMFLALSCGASLIIPSTTIKIIPSVLCDVFFFKKRLTILQATPSLVKRFSLKQLHNFVFSGSASLRILALGGEDCLTPYALNQIIHPLLLESKFSKIKFFNLYGITEVSCWATIYEIPWQDIKLKSNKPVPIGMPLSNTTIKIFLQNFNSESNLRSSITVTQNHKILKDYDSSDEGNDILEMGLLYIGGGLRVCTILPPQEKISNFISTGDLVQCVNQDNSFEIIYKGRTDGIVKRNGKLINLLSIQQSLESFDNIFSCHVTINNKKDPFEILAFIVPHVNKLNLSNYHEKGNLDLEKVSTNFNQYLTNKLKVLLPRHSLPDKMFQLSNIPTTVHGKANNKMLLKTYFKYKDHTNNNIKVPQLCSEEKLTEFLVSDICQINHKILSQSKNKTLLQLGCDSIKAVTLLNFIEDNYDVANLPNIFEILLTESIENIIYKVINCSKQKHKSKHTISKLVNEKNEECSKRRKLKDASSVEELVKTKTSVSTIENVFLFEKMWAYDTGKCVDASPLIFECGDDLFCCIGSHSSRFCCVSLKKGTKVWEQVLEDRIESSACLTSCGQYVAVGCYDGCVYAFEAKAGKIIFQFQTNGIVKSSPCHGANGSSVIYVTSYSSFLYCLNIQKQTVEWKKSLGSGGIFSSPCLYENALCDKTVSILYCCTLNGDVFCLSSKNGEEVWHINLKKPVFSSAMACSYGVCVGCVDFCVYMLKHDNGQMQWKYETSQPVFSSPRFANDLVFIGSHDGRLHCIDRFTGALKWKSEASKFPIYSTPLIFVINQEQYVMFIHTDGRMFISRAKSGSVVLQHKLEGEVFSSPKVCKFGDQYYILVGCRDDNVYCYTINCIA